MQAETILRSDVLDILFEHRNKQYGAYTLRREYPRHLKLSLGIMGILILVAIGFSQLKQKDNLNGQSFIPSIDGPDSVKLVVLDPPPPAQPTPPPAPRPKATIQSTTPLIVKDLVKPDMPTVEEIDNAVIDTRTIEGDPDDHIQQGPAGPPSNAPAAPIPPPAEEAPTIFSKAEVMPEFPGGTAALHRWLSKNIRPNEDQEPGSRIRVLVRFVVGADGRIEQAFILQTGGETYDNEVLRVVKKMPDWIPGQQNGKKVPVYFSLPVIFEAPEQ